MKSNHNESLLGPDSIIAFGFHGVTATLAYRHGYSQS